MTFGKKKTPAVKRLTPEHKAAGNGRAEAISARIADLKATPGQWWDGHDTQLLNMLEGQLEAETGTNAVVARVRAQMTCRKK